jgi:hypothetical protein
LTQVAKIQGAALAAPKAAEMIASLPPREYPMLKTYAEALAAHTAGNDPAEPSWEAADRFAELAIAGVTVYAEKAS